MSPTNPLHHQRYPESNTYDPDWVIANQMGPSALWLLESLTEVLSIAPGSKVIDLGCGRAMTSTQTSRSDLVPRPTRAGPKPA